MAHCPAEQLRENCPERDQTARRLRQLPASAQSVRHCQSGRRLHERNAIFSSLLNVRWLFRGRGNNADRFREVFQHKRLLARVFGWQQARPRPNRFCAGTNVAPHCVRHALLSIDRHHARQAQGPKTYRGPLLTMPESCPLGHHARRKRSPVYEP